MITTLLAAKQFSFDDVTAGQCQVNFTGRNISLMDTGYQYATELANPPSPLAHAPDVEPPLVIPEAIHHYRSQGRACARQVVQDITTSRDVGTIWILTWSWIWLLLWYLGWYTWSFIISEATSFVEG
ncbi:uncharacterized protein A4U43_C06F18320 [Asparagus officinalis]|uniref:Uncharacterized protein n=1 Tax=Asparagus officinalis TaxID=4686 RepID=A0A5P1ENM6_ASPOF|nr:uncharacterized protein A4U43_C06F18320 [Asparagus officinalis]